jgi:arginase family enzyme
MMTPLVLDFDASVLGLDAAQRIDLRDGQEAIRFGCSLRRWRALRAQLAREMPAQHGTVLLGSGDLHHLSHLLIERCAAPQFDVLVFDNHPDNMRFPFGIHCGSWVRHAARLPQVRRIDVVGICSADIGAGHAWENYWRPLLSGKLHYWSVGVDMRWAQRFGLAAQMHAFADQAALLAAFGAHLQATSTPVYLSIDKDVLAPEVAHTNWDQGSMQLEQMEALIALLAGRVVGSDITGDISAYRYRSAWKRWLSALDEQPEIAPAQLAQWQAQQAAVNRRLLPLIAAQSR